MVVLEYGFGGLPGHGFVGESNLPMRWPYQVKRKSRSDAASAAASLEDEIARLRKRMEEAFLECDSLTSEMVVEISRLLDAKINEYMQHARKN